MVWRNVCGRCCCGICYCYALFRVRGYDDEKNYFDLGVDGLYNAVMNEEKRLEDAGLTISGTSPDGELAEFAEVSGNLFYVSTQAHPEMKSRPYAPHPLFRGLVQAAIEHKKEREEK